MESIDFLICIIIAITILGIDNVISIHLAKPSIGLTIRVVLSTALLTFVVVLAFFLYRSEEKYDEYNYDRENPNALITGKNIAGTVYASYPGNTPGLGWIV